MFGERLKVELKLTADGGSAEIPGADVKAFSVSLRPWGFEAEATFWVSLETGSDPIFDWFVEPGLVKASLSVKGVTHMPAPAPDPIAVQGLVTEKAIFEETYEISGTPILFRRYRIEFADAARVLWRQHHPIALYTDTTMKDVIEAQKVSGIALEYDWDPVLTETHPVVCLGCDLDRGRASFYDFLQWYVREWNGVFTYDAKENKYRIAAAKSEEGTPSILRAAEVAHLDWVAPAPLRRDAHIMSASSKEHKDETITLAAPGAVAPMRRDYLMIAPVAARVDARKAIETARLVSEEPLLDIEFGTWPTITMHPGRFVRLETGGWSTKILPYMDEFRVTEVDLAARAEKPSPEADRGLKETGYKTAFRARAETKADPTPRGPAFRPPEWPIYAEGRVVSEVPEDKERTYQIYTDAATSLEMYKVNVPLWNKKVIAPYEPGLEPGHFYFPAYRDQRVLVRLDFQAARIERYLDWAAGAKLDQTTQGNHLLLGKSATSETSIKHHYVDSKPVLEVKRVSGADRQTLTISEGSMKWEVKKEEAAAGSEPEFDVTVDVETAKGELRGQVGGAVTELTGAFATAEGAVAAEIGAATSELGAKLDAAEGDVADACDGATAELEEMKSGLGSAVDAAKAKAEAAKAELFAATQ